MSVCCYGALLTIAAIITHKALTFKGLFHFGKLESRVWIFVLHISLHQLLNIKLLSRLFDMQRVFAVLTELVEGVPAGRGRRG